MKRTAERVLGIIGSILLGIGTLLIISLIVALGNPEVRAEIDSILLEESPDPELQLSGEEVNEMNVMLDAFAEGGGIVIVIGYVIAVILAVVATILVKKKTILSGVFFLLAAVIPLFVLWFMAIIPSILFIIAGLLALIRKAPPEQPQAEPLNTL